MEDMMTESEISQYAERYEDEGTDLDSDIEQELTDVLKDQDYLTKEQVAKCIEWKLQGQTGRRDRYIKMLKEDVSDETVELLTEAAFNEDDPVTQLKILRSLPGIGNATATVLFTFNNPEDYCVGDRYINREILNKDQSVRPSNYVDLLQKLREIGKGHDLRTVEKAYYRRYRDRNE